ncbi:uncharacterized protein LOC134564302 isoform X3 [Prinia subflava]|uniref:uncharacterized protein LOC134564302 isoform X3 n=1 Tax=Prinia subflava TaxID=208062 RepID=UPI002FDF8D74
MALQWMFLLLLTPLLAIENRGKPHTNNDGKPQETGKCKAPSDWDPKLRFNPKKDFYALNEVVQLSCAGKKFAGKPAGKSAGKFAGKFVPSTPEIQCISRGALMLWNETATCKERCHQPQWDSQLQFSPNQTFYWVNEEVTLSCFVNDTLPLATIRCANRTSPNWKDAWDMLDNGGIWHRLAENLSCTMAKCPKPQWDARLQLPENKTEYPQNRELTLTCPEGLEPSFPEVKCTKEFQGVSSGKPVYVHAWWGRNTTDAWMHIERDVQCMEVLQVDPKTFEISSTSIKLKWTCRFPDACQGMRAMCRLAEPSSPPCEPEEVKGEQMLHGQEGTFTCSPLQPFTEYSVTIGLPPNTTLFSWLFTTQEAVPDKPEKLWLDPNRGSLRWNSLSSCNGEIIGYQLSITARNAGDSSVLETERLRLNGSVTEHRLPEHGPGSSYAVAIRGLTAAGAGPALTREFPPGSSDAPRPQGIIGCRSARDIAASHGTAVLPLRPIARASEAAREHQLIVAATHNASVIESICSGQPQLFNATTYLAAVLNLTAPTDFVLGDGSRGQGQHNAALRPGCDYTALLRLARLSPQAEKFTCVCYSFSVGQELPSLMDRKPVVMALALTVAFLALGILLLFLVFRLKHNSSNASENNSTIPLRGCQKDDHCRVVLQPSDPGNGYINASYVDTYRSPRFFIAAQGPLAETVVDFWHMVWQEKTSVIVMLTGLMEQNKIKCEQYWPEQEQVYGDFTVTLNNTWTTTGLVKRIFCLQKAGCALPRAVEQFHYLLWPDHGVPRNPSQLLYLVEVVNKRVLEAPAGPVLVHCSAGIGRTGTFIALDFLLKMGKTEGKVDVFHCVQQLREQRVSMVQTKEQYSFLYEALLEGLLCGNTGVPVESIATLVHSLREDETSGHNSVLKKEFKALQRFSELFQLLPCREAEKPRNQPKNRKPGILPADSCRPILMSSVNADGSPAYINAVFASTYTEEERIIITQLPFPTTLVDFWALVWDYTCTSVVVLNQLQELDKTYVQFWPTQDEDDYGRFHVQLISEEPGAGFTTWTLVLSNRQQPKKSAVEIQLHQLTDWPMQQHLPPHPDTIISLLGKVETHHRQSQDGHILVTCWDGASRSGIFCAASFLCEQIQSEGMVDVSQAVRMLKRRRRQFIKDVEQYGLCYELALSYLNSFETYGNFK